MDRLEAMRAYAQIVDSGSFTKAAGVLGMHKATLSQHIRQLEEALGVRLLARTTRSVAPTPEGMAYYERVVPILGQLAEVEDQLRLSGSTPRGRLRIEVPSAIGRFVLARELGSFLERYPGLDVEMGCSDRPADLVREGIDCAVRGGALQDSRLVCRRLDDLRFVLCASPAYVARNGLPDRPEALSAHWAIGYRPLPGGELPEITLARGNEATTVGMPARLVTNDSGALLAAGLNGLGMLVAAEFVVRPYLESGALIRVLPTWHLPARPVYVVTPTARLRTERVRVFIAWLDEVLGGYLSPAPGPGDRKETD